ncbi:hypothetical protein HMPREF0454_00052 [Hafnia alvei ATCC 51873]|uniref:Uncharacterized protein n=1 Tax=Hafnia alvei ATCC 51873 TaxID=1002364 RepID=G9Y0J5_HAFAL|nr:hypothetical protein HMPREF0454_00052 [Hafnia alvei ATCC 51873]
MAAIHGLAAALSDHLFLAFLSTEAFSDTKINGRQLQRTEGHFHQVGMDTLKAGLAALTEAEKRHKKTLAKFVRVIVMGGTTQGMIRG